MFVDYYALFEISEFASLEEIKAAFRSQAIKFHPDKNLNKDTTLEMQLINEAYLILKDTEARIHYDKEYQLYKQYRFNKWQLVKDEPEFSSKWEQTGQENNFTQNDYKMQDDILKKWMSNAKRQAVDLAKETIIDFKGTIASGIKHSAVTTGKVLVAQIVIGIIVAIFASIRTCN